MEIERKWLIDTFPDDKGLKLLFSATMLQGYICTAPAVRIRKTTFDSGEVSYVLCFKGKGLLARSETELDIDEPTFLELQNLLCGPLIVKDFCAYELPCKKTLEVSCVDKGTPTQFYYAEVEFDSEQEANDFIAPGFLGKEVTYSGNFSMSKYWQETRAEKT